MARPKRFDCRFGSVGPAVQNDGTAASGTADEINLITLGGLPFSYQVIGTNTTVVPAIAATGVDVVMTDTNGQGAIWSPHSNSLASPLKFTIGTDAAFYATLKFTITDASGTFLMWGFHGGSATMQAHTATWANYTDKACIGLYSAGTDPNPVYTSTANDNAADVDVDSTVTVSDAQGAAGITFTVKVSAAGVVTWEMYKGTTAQTLTTGANAGYTFDDGDVVTPFLYIKNHTDTAGAIVLQQMTVGLQ